MSQHTFEITGSAITELVSNRISIPLDMNVWNFLARDVNAEATTAKHLLNDLVAQGKVFCPLTFSVIVELFKQNAESALRTAGLMDELSLGLCFAFDKEIYKKEVKFFLQRFVDGKEISLPKTEIYVPVVAFLGSVGALLFPSEFPEEMREEFTQQFATKLESLKLTDIVNTLKGSLPLPQLQQLPTPQFSEVWKERWDHAKGNRDKMREVERDHWVRTVLIPELQQESSNLPEEARQKLMIYLKSLPRQKPGLAADEILTHMPAVTNAIEILTISGVDPSRKSTMNDFFDMQMLFTSLAYADMFVATDKWIVHLLNTVRSVFDDKAARCIPSLSDLIAYLETLKVREVASAETETTADL